MDNNSELRTQNSKLKTASQLAGSVRRYWIKAQLRAPSTAHRRLIPLLHDAKEIIRLLTKPNMSVSELQGRGFGGPLTVAYIGLAFTKPFLIDLIFGEDRVEKDRGRIPFWRCSRTIGTLSSDMVIVEASKHLVCRLPRQNAFISPPSVHHILDVRGDWEDVRKRIHKSVLKDHMRLIRKYGYDYDTSHDRHDFEEFYYHMYLPTMQDRHDDLSMPVSFREAFEYFRSGLIFRIKRDGNWVAGGLCHTQHDMLILDILGVKHGDVQLVKEGALGAHHYPAVQWAHQHGYHAVNFQGSSARLASGLFQHKRKWGATVRVPPHLQRRLWIRVQRVTPAVAWFLKENPFIVMDEADHLHGLIVVDDAHHICAETHEEWEKRYATPGLDSLRICSIHSFAQGSANSQSPDLLVPIVSNSTSGLVAHPSLLRPGGCA